ncbi:MULTISPECIES: RNA polymerase factor sigma-54 [Legionella]|uniref:RNA polymerase sigma-54 factor n=1 Tax=Legionella maceachernii TaxID=466 RepID=A0A0W0VUL3_9GAMM|nr:RNA polymerase factor sigma-54 [Legionella maceachernii]KTD23988.1 RNA polymerase sigma-54 factor (sigma-L) [Legionella maceachernii]SKA19297.1 RNA polymerase, sigma 54 subunit, RpoN/SigL [Legionella maceachernii]SUP04382.1 RNA polymerase factor sigma-54 [Legionella maceachernii]
MKPSLQLSISQQLTLTPQLQQAIRLLQLSTIDLQQEIQQVVESNPMLEIIPNEEKEEPRAENKQNLDEFTDFQWSQLYNTSKKASFEDIDINYENLYSTTTNLQDHLRWQLDLTPMSDVDRVIATSIIDAIDDDGFLTLSLAELHASLDSETHPLDLEEIEVVRHRLQHFDPVGCASYNLAETLLIQLDQLPTNADVDLAKQIIRNDIELLGQHNYRQLMKNHQIDEAHLDKALQIIQRLNPKPGNLIQQEVTEYIIPDITVKKIDGLWQASLNPSTLPRLSINNHYASLIQRADNSADNQFLKNNLQEARWFLKSIQSRQETLLKVARCIVEYQQDFLEHGEEAMKPLILNDVAQALDMHESTISRVTTQKFMHTPRGVFELKYFFSSHVGTISGGECSSTAIRAVIKKLIAAENRKKPLSDSKIAQLIGEQGIQVARRTVAKYREAMGIAPSNERKTIRS